MSEIRIGFSSYLKDFLSNKMGLAGLAILIVLLIFTGIALSIPSNVYHAWFNPAAWEEYPRHVPPAWMSIFYPGKYFTSENLSPTNISIKSYGKNLYIAIVSYQFNWSKKLPPPDVYFLVYCNTTSGEEEIYWTKPDGNTIEILVPSSSYNELFDLISVKSGIIDYIFSVTGKMPSTVSSELLSSALFNSPKSDFTVTEQGKYSVKIEIISLSPIKITASYLLLIGNSYGLMGTDYFGRPIDLGILLGLPNALGIGALTSVVSVLVGVFVGGIAGYLGGNKDAAIQWVILVFLTLPTLPFLIAVSFVVRPSLVLEALLISFLSWPGYAIIARSAALSIKSNAFVEADKLLGIPSYRVFFTHFMPRLIPMTVAYMALAVPGGILLSQSLAFLGIAPANTVNWGEMLNSAYTYQAQANGYWWWVIFPGLMIVIVSMAFVFIGFAIEKVTLGER